MMRAQPSRAAVRKPGRPSLKDALKKPGKKDGANIIERKNLDDIIYQRIIQMIINQELLPGQRVYLDHLADQMESAVRRWSPPSSGWRRNVSWTG